MKTKTFFFSLIVAMCAFAGFNACNPAITPDEPNVSDKDTAVVTPQDTVPTDTIPSDTIPILPQDTIPSDTIIIPQDTIPADTIPVVPEDTIVVVEPEPVTETYTVTYMLDDAIYETQAYTEGEAIILPTEPTREGYMFTGWSEMPSVMPAYDITVTGSWQPMQYTITTSAENGTVSGGGTYDYNTPVTLTATPNEGYQFAGWSDGETTASRTITVTENAKYKAVFAPIQYHIYYKSDDITLADYHKNYGESLSDVTPPADPIKEGFNFTGWSRTLPATMPNGDITINAVWEEIQLPMYYGKFPATDDAYRPHMITQEILTEGINNGTIHEAPLGALAETLIDNDQSGVVIFVLLPDQQYVARDVSLGDSLFQHENNVETYHLINNKKYRAYGTLMISQAGLKVIVRRNN